jgi:hypothetical protein
LAAPTQRRIPIRTMACRSNFASRAVIAVVALAPLAWASDSARPARLYDVTTQTGMPHLEENLRYSITHEKRCLGQPDLAHAFPVLEHPSLRGCQLEPGTQSSERAEYRLACEGNHGTTGEAVWQLGERQMIGTLHVKLGGKNMTFYQRVTAIAVGDCAPCVGESMSGIRCGAGVGHHFKRRQNGALALPGTEFDVQMTVGDLRLE